MPKKKASPKRGKKSLTTASRAKKAARKGASVIAKAGAKAKSRAGSAAKSVAKAAANSKRTVRRAAANVHASAARARDVGETVTAAGELIQQTADFVDAVAQRSATRAGQRRKRR